MLSEAKAVEPKTELLGEALALAREAVTLRGRLTSAQREHAELLEQREELLREGRDVLPQVRDLYLEIESLPARIAKLDERIRWIVDQSVEKINSENNQIAVRHYRTSRDNLRQALERFSEALASVQRDMKADVDLGPSLTEVHNSKLAEIERILGKVHFPRVFYRPLPLPTVDAELVRSGQVLAAIDRWIGGLC